MPPVRTLLFLVPLVKALRPSTTPAKQLSTASSMKARVASQKAGQDRRGAQTQQHDSQNAFLLSAHAHRCSTLNYKMNRFSVEYNFAEGFFFFFVFLIFC